MKKSFDEWILDVINRDELSQTELTDCYFYYLGSEKHLNLSKVVW